MSDKLIPLTLLQKYMGHNAGEVAGFDPKTARDLLNSKYAIPFVDRAAVTKGEPAASEHLSGEDTPPGGQRLSDKELAAKIPAVPTTTRRGRGRGK